MAEGYYGSGAVRALRFELVDPRYLQPAQSEDIKELIASSLGHDFTAEHSNAAVVNATARRIAALNRLDETVPGAQKEHGKDTLTHVV